MSTPKHRPRRIASDEAHAWARNLRLGNPYAKLTLCMLTGYIQADATCFVGIEALAEDTELSADTVRKRLAWLETVGAIVRLPQWVDASGRRNGDGQGKRTTDEIRLLLSADTDLIERRAAGDLSESSEPVEGVEEGHGTTFSPRSQQGLNEPQGSVSPRPALGQPSDSRKGQDSLNHEPESSPYGPPSGDAADELSEGEESEASSWPHLESWSRFEAAWQEPILRQRLCRQLWTAFSEAEREQAILVAQGYVLWRAAQRKPPNPVNAERMLRERDAWPAYVARAPKPRPVEPVHRIALDSAEFIAIHIASMIGRFELPKATGDPPAIEFIGDIPQGAAAMAQCGNDLAAWVIRKTGTPEFTAWCKRVQEWTGRSPQPQRFWLDAQGQIVPKERAYIPPERQRWGMANSADGLLVPDTLTGFPPPKGAQQDGDAA